MRYLLPRIMPCLLLSGRGLVKGIKFKKHQYVGDPVNVVRIYNEKEVDELILLDIRATPEKLEPNYRVVEEVAGECFMPLAYGGGVTSVKQMARLFQLGVEKVALNSSAALDEDLVREAAGAFGSQSVIVSMDVKKDWLGRYRICINSGAKTLKRDPVEFARRMQDAGAGEILLTSVDRDGTMEGFDLELVQAVSKAVSLPVIACGGAGKVEHFGQVIKQAGASAAAAGSMVVFQGKGRGVLINFPTQEELAGVLAPDENAS